MVFSRLGIFPCWRSKLVGTSAILHANSTYTSCLQKCYHCCYCTWSWCWPNLIITILIFKLQSTNVSNASNDQVYMTITLFITQVELILQLCEGVQAMIWSDDIEKSTPRKTTYSTTYSQKRRIRWRRYVSQRVVCFFLRQKPLLQIFCTVNTVLLFFFPFVFPTFFVKNQAYCIFYSFVHSDSQDFTWFWWICRFFQWNLQFCTVFSVFFLSIQTK